MLPVELRLPYHLDPISPVKISGCWRLEVQTSSSDSEADERISILKADIVRLTQKNAELSKQVRELSETLRLAEQRKDTAQKQFLALGEQPKARPFGVVKSLRTSPTVKPDESVNPRLAKILEKVAVRKELIVVLANSNVKDMLDVQISTNKKAGIPNYLVVALDDEIENYCKLRHVSVF